MLHAFSFLNVLFLSTMELLASIHLSINQGNAKQMNHFSLSMQKLLKKNANLI